VENSLIDSAMNQQKAQHQSLQEFTVPASSEVKTPLAEANDYEIPI
jgi:hypothetical protein